jgi:amidase
MRARIGRRTFLKASAGAGAVLAVASSMGACTENAAGSAAASGVGTDHGRGGDPDRWVEASIADMQRSMASGETTALELIRDHLDRIERIDWDGPRLNALIEANPDAEAIARDLDRERANGHVRGPLHGIPIVLKDCVATADRMETTAGSLALVGATPPRDAGVVSRLREAGAVILGKANMSEWNAFRGYPSRGGWSARAGVGKNPYALNHSTGDSSAGSAAAVAASLTAGGVGLETYGSIVMPSSLCGVVGLKPTAGLIGGSGTIPISFSRDAVGPIARTVSDLAALLDGMVGPDPLDERTKGSRDHIPSSFLPTLRSDGLRNARIGVWRSPHLWRDRATARVIEDLLAVFSEEGATLVEGIELPHWMEATGEHTTVMSAELRFGIARYLSTLADTQIRTLDDVIAFNLDHADEELRWHPQNLLESASEDMPLSDPRYRRALRLSDRLGRTDLDTAFREHRLDAIVGPTFVRAWTIDLISGDPPVGNGIAGPSNAAGYPNLTVPAGLAEGLPVGISFLGRAWDEPTLLRLGYAFEQAVRGRRPPRYLDAGADFVPR